MEECTEGRGSTCDMCYFSLVSTASFRIGYSKDLKTLAIVLVVGKAYAVATCCAEGRNEASHVKIDVSGRASRPQMGRETLRVSERRALKGVLHHHMDSADCL
jgi:hypothetical protein